MMLPRCARTGPRARGQAFDGGRGNARRHRAGL
jgi:hypothetical protein